jgi:hypothetical protein
LCSVSSDQGTDVDWDWGAIIHWRTGHCLLWTDFSQGGKSGTPLKWGDCGSQFSHWDGSGFRTAIESEQTDSTCGTAVWFDQVHNKFTGGTNLGAGVGSCTANQPTASQFGWLNFVDPARAGFRLISHTNFGSYSSGVSQVLTYNPAGGTATPVFAPIQTGFVPGQEWYLNRIFFPSGQDSAWMTEAADGDGFVTILRFGGVAQVQMQPEQDKSTQAARFRYTSLN